MPRSSSGARPAAIGLLAAIVAAACAGYGVALFAVGAMHFDFFSASDRRHLDPIPIDRTKACGSVETIHAALDSLNTSYTAATLGISPEQWIQLRGGVESGTLRSDDFATRQPSWPAVEADVDAAAARLDLILVAGIPHFPRPLRKELSIVRASIADGRRQLAEIDDTQELGSLTSRAFDRGKLHAGYASDLVGHQCSVPLGA